MLFSIGAEFGAVICLSSSGVLAANLGWESIFYVWGAVGCAWCILWMTLVFDSPKTHPRIQDNEKTYIVEYTQVQNVSKLPHPPIIKILTSRAVIVNVITTMGNSYAFYTLLSMTPTYLNNIQHFDITQVYIIICLIQMIFI